MAFSQEKIEQLIKQYETHRAKERERYQLRKDDPEFIEKNRQRARDHYQKNKEKKRESYFKNKTYILYKNQYNYHKRKDNIAFFIKKYPDRHKYLIESGYLEAFPEPVSLEPVSLAPKTTS